MTFTTSNAGSNAVVKPISNELVNAEVDGSTLIIRAPAVDFSTNQTTLSVEISYGGQSTTTTIPITVTNSSGLEYVAQANALFSGISTIGDEDVSLAASVTDIAPVNNIVLDDELASLADFVSTLQTSSETTQFTSSISSSLLAYSNDEIDENALYEAIIDAELYFSSAPVEELNSLMVPFANFLGDFTMSEVSEFTYSQDYSTYSRYINNTSVGVETESGWAFNDDVSYLSLLLPAVAGTTPCSVLSGDDE